MKGLRAGNWVYAGINFEDCNPHAPTGLIEIQVQPGGESADHLYPIPLSGEILEFAGFQHLDREEIVTTLGLVDFDSLWISGNYFLAYVGNSLRLHHYREGSYWTLEPEVRHLHQLQNLLYDLTSRELHFKIHQQYG